MISFISSIPFGQISTGDIATTDRSLGFKRKERRVARCRTSQLITCIKGPPDLSASSTSSRQYIIERHSIDGTKRVGDSRNATYLNAYHTGAG